MRLIVGLLALSCFAQIERVDSARQGVVYCHEMPGATVADKINACIGQAAGAGGKIADARGFTGASVSATSIDLCQQSSGSAHLKLLLGNVTLIYDGTGDALIAETPGDASKLCRFIEVQGSGRYTTTITVASGKNAQSLVHLRYATHVALKDLTLYAPGAGEGRLTQRFRTFW